MTQLNWTRRRWLASMSAVMTTPLLTPFLKDVAAQGQGQMPRRFVFVIAAMESNRNRNAGYDRRRDPSRRKS